MESQVDHNGGKRIIAAEALGSVELDCRKLGGPGYMEEKAPWAR